MLPSVGSATLTPLMVNLRLLSVMTVPALLPKKVCSRVSMVM